MSVELKRKSPLGGQCDNKKALTDEAVEAKITKLVNAVLSSGPLGGVVVIHHGETEHPFVTLQNSLASSNKTVTVTRDEPYKNTFQLRIAGEIFIAGDFPNAQVAKQVLGKDGLGKLRETCFFIQKKDSCVHVTKETLEVSEDTTTPIVLETTSAAYKIMMKMGWTGKGLGAQEQGSSDIVTLSENVNRQGFGTSNLQEEITKKLRNFAASSKLNLIFNSEFSKEERGLIHSAARKFNLKSKSSGKDNNRKLTISKKITRMDIVKELLRIGGEDNLYILQIPPKFKDLW